MLAPKLEETARAEVGSVSQPQYVREKLSTDTVGPVLALASKSNPNSTTAAVRVPIPSITAPNLDRLKQEKPKGSLSNSMDELKMGVDGTLIKKKVKRRPEQELDDTHFRAEKLHSQSSEERHKSLKQTTGLPQKLNLQSTAPPSFEQSS